MSEQKARRFSWTGAVLFILGAGLIIYSLTLDGKGSTTETTWDNFRKNLLLSRKVSKIEVVDNKKVLVYLKETTSDRPKSRIGKPEYFFKIGSLESFERRLDEAQINLNDAEKVEVSYSESSDLSGIIYWLLPMGFFLLLYFYFSRALRSAGGAGTAINFSRSKAKEYQKGQLSRVTFKEVAGYEEAKAEVMEVVEFLKNPGNFTKVGAKIPKGILLIGPPGTGKTLMAKAVAGEAAVPFFSLSGSEFVELFVGVGASRVRDLFDRAKEKAPSIIFIDEIDTVGRMRGRAVSVQVNDERESTLNQLLAEMDGFEPNTGVIVIAATNRADILDPALLRAGRFDRHVYLELPNRQEREAIFKVHLANLVSDSDIDAATLAAQTPGFSGADIANVCNEAALIAARRKRTTVSRGEFSDAIDRVVAGIEKKTRVITPAEKKTIAYHEAGHVVVSWVLPLIDTISKVSIVPRGKTLGGAWYLPEEKQLVTRSKFCEQLSATLAGRAAEELVFHEVSSGALDDLEKATKQAYSMVVNFGLSEKLGNLSYYDTTGTYQNAFQKPYSEATAKLIDEEVRLLIHKAYDIAKDILETHQQDLSSLAEMLLEKEVLMYKDIESVLGKRGMDKKTINETSDEKAVH